MIETKFIVVSVELVYSMSERGEHSTVYLKRQCHCQNNHSSSLGILQWH